MFFRQNSLRFPSGFGYSDLPAFGVCEEDEYFGRILAAGDFNGDGFDDLAVGMPAQEIDTVAQSDTNDGEINIVDGSTSGLYLWTSTAYDGYDLDEALGEGSSLGWVHNHFGVTLAASNGEGAADLAIGVPGYTIPQAVGDDVTFAGAVAVMLGSQGSTLAADRTELWSQASPDIEDCEEANDHFGGPVMSFPHLDWLPRHGWKLQHYQPTFSSKPNASHNLYLDFNGHTEDGTNWDPRDLFADDIVTPSFNLAGSNPYYFNRTERSIIRDVWYAVAEDFAPFDINVTTVYPNDGRIDDGEDMRVAIGGSCSDWYDEDVWGVANIGSFTNSSLGNVGYVFSEDILPQDASAITFDHAIDIAAICSHEAGHTFGLYHKSDAIVHEPGVWELLAEYSWGGNGWTPIMGGHGNRTI
jgi:hypothetical protein